LIDFLVPVQMGLGEIVRKFISRSSSISSEKTSSIISTVKTKITPMPKSVSTRLNDGSLKSNLAVAKQKVTAFLDPRDDGQICGGKDGKMPLNDWAVWVERTWRCACGHTFRAHGIWVPSEPGMCEAPGCPNPRFFMLECNKQYLIPKKGSQALITPPPPKK